MNDDDESERADRRRESQRWLAVAEEDIRVARACLDLADPVLSGAAYHCQQAAEKML